MKTIYMETTKKEPEETSAEIAKLLKTYKLSRFMNDYQDGEISGCVFTIKVGEKNVPVRMPIRWTALWEMARRGETKYIRDEAQARRVAWRQALRWVEAQLAMVDIAMVDIVEVFLPYMMIDSGRTLYERLVENDMQLLEAPR